MGAIRWHCAEGFERNGKHSNTVTEGLCSSARSLKELHNISCSFFFLLNYVHVRKKALQTWITEKSIVVFPPCHCPCCVSCTKRFIAKYREQLGRLYAALLQMLHHILYILRKENEHPPFLLSSPRLFINSNVCLSGILLLQ